MKKDYAKIAKKGEAIYEKIKAKYEPKHNGKFLVIEVESADVYLAKSSIEAIDLARKEHPDKVFHLVKIGYDSIGSLANFIFHGTQKKLSW